MLAAALEPLVLSVDVGTASARAGLFDAHGCCHGHAEAELGPWRGQGGFGPQARAEHSSEAIWAAVCAAVRGALAGVEPLRVTALGFDATCSLVLRDGAGAPLALSAGCDTIAWFDHRAVAEAAECSALGEVALGGASFGGGAVSPEMQLPKLIWLKRHRPELWAKLGAAYDLGDFLTWRATGSGARSACTLTAKWGYLAHQSAWPDAAFAALGMEDLRARAGLPEAPLPVGAVVGQLSAQAAGELGLAAGLPVSAALIDAFAGALGAIGGEAAPEQSLALIAGTSTCVMALSRAPRAAQGLWGPYFGAILPDYWVCEGGQTASGAALDHVLSLRGGDISPKAHAQLGARLAEILATQGYDFAQNLHILPDFAGNRSPHADPLAQSLIFGATLDASFDGFCALYWRVAMGLALSLKQIIAHMAEVAPAERAVSRLVVTGGHGRSELLMQLYADATGREVALCTAPDAVLAGTAMAAMAAAKGADLAQVARAMAPARRIFTPEPRHAAAIARDYQMFLALQQARAGLTAR